MLQPDAESLSRRRLARGAAAVALGALLLAVLLADGCGPRKAAAAAAATPPAASASPTPAVRPATPPASPTAASAAPTALSCFPTFPVAPLELPPGWDREQLQPRLAAGLERLARERLPGAVVSRNGLDDSIRLVWQSRMYDVRRPVSKGKGTEYVVRREEGPAPAGLILTVWLGDGISQAMRPQVLGNDGKWQTYLGEAVHVPALELYLTFNLDYGPQTRPELLRLFSSPREWLAAAADTPAASPASVAPSPAASPPPASPVPPPTRAATEASTAPAVSARPSPTAPPPSRVASPAPSPSPTPDPDLLVEAEMRKLLSEFTERMREVKTVKADFEYENYNAEWGETEREKGDLKLDLRDPENVRVREALGDARLRLLTREHFVVYLPPEKHAMVYKFVPQEPPPTPSATAAPGENGGSVVTALLRGARFDREALEEHFRLQVRRRGAARERGPEEFQLELRPKSPKTARYFRYVRLWFDREGDWLRRLAWESPNGDRESWRFTKVKRNPVFAEKDFEFKPKTGTKVEERELAVPKPPPTAATPKP